MTTRQMLACCALALACTGVEALTLSEAQIQSHLGEPLDIRLSVSNDRPLVAEQVRVRFGTREEAASAGVDSSGLPQDAALTVEQEGPSLRVHILTEDSVAQPFIDFLLVVESPEARLQRHYTLLVDLPN